MKTVTTAVNICYFESIKSFGMKFCKNFILNLLFLSLVLFASCAKDQENQVVKDIKLTTTLDSNSNELWISISALFDLGGMAMTAITLPVRDPYDPERVYGKIFFKPTIEGTYNEVGVQINLSDCAKIPGGIATLPNGEVIPISGIEKNRVLELRIDQIQSKVYVALDSDLTLFGFAITIDQFDQVAAYIGGANVFLGFDIFKVRGMAGLYTGLDPSQSGLGFFVDLSSVITTDILNDIINGTPIDPIAFRDAKANKSVTWSKEYYKELNHRFADQLPSAKQQKKLKKILKKMAHDKTVLTFTKEE
ncbi:MAG: hypothetical protein HQK53_16575 [Oligoflexia bacterium]|nr:hypothetical protein [Oligoflexia bacterium]